MLLMVCFASLWDLVAAEDLSGRGQTDRGKTRDFCSSFWRCCLIALW